MKIIGFVYNDELGVTGDGLRVTGDEKQKADGEWKMVLKGDSCMLNNRKPFFVPDWTEETCVTECIVLRVSRLGKEIARKFAGRYYDAIAYGADFTAMDILREAQAKGEPWTRAIAFDYSLAIGKWREVNDGCRMTDGEWLMSPEEAIVEASKVMTIRQGDLIYIQRACPPRPVQKGEIIRVETNGEEELYCRVV